MVAKDSADLKRRRLQKLSRIIAKAFSEKKKVNVESLLDYIEYNFGLTRKKGRSYINLICKNKNWEIVGKERKAFIQVIESKND